MEDNEPMPDPFFLPPSPSPEDSMAVHNIGQGAPSSSAPDQRLSFSHLQSFNNLASELGLDTKYREIALRIAERPPHEFNSCMALYMASIAQDIKAMKNESLTGTGSRETNVLREWRPSDELTDHVRRIAQATLTQPDLESYTANHDSMKRPLSGSFSAKVLNHLHQQPHVWKTRLLPPGFSVSSDPGPAQVLILQVKKIIKHNRDSFRKMLLVHVLDDHQQAPTHPIPTLTDLITDIMINSRCAGLDTRDQVMSRLTMEHKMRFSFIHLAALFYYTHPTPNKNRSQWTLIDDTLATLRTKTNVWRQAFFALVLEKDHELFGSGTALFTELIENPAVFALPSDGEVDARAALLEPRLSQSS